MKEKLKIIITIIISFILLPNIYNAFEIQQEDGSYKTVKNIPYSGYKYSYTKCNGLKLKDKDVIYNEETQTFTMNDITEISKCNFYFDRDGNEIINRYTVNVTVLNGTINGETSKTVNQGSDVSFTLEPSEGYGNPEVTCTNNQTGIIKGNTLTINSVNNDTTCTVTYYDLTETCFAFNKSTGTIIDYYDYQGGGTSGTECSRDVIIPSTIKGISVNAIGNYAFSENQLTSVVIPDKVTEIGHDAFAENQLTTVTIPDSVTYIGSSAFSYNQLTTVKIGDSVTTIDDYAFQSNKITTVTMGDGVTTIGNSVFRENQLTTVIIPDKVTTIDDYAFAANQLTTVRIPDNVTTIGTYAFQSNKITTVTMGDSLITIGNGAFRNNELTTVTIPDSVTTIENHAFNQNQLTTVTIGKSVTTIGKSAFYTASTSNPNLTRIVNKTGRAFDWGLITSSTSGNDFITGSFTSPTKKTLTVSAE